MNHRDDDWLLGRRYACDFTVAAIAGDAARTVTLRMNGGDDDGSTYRISHAELMTVIERGFVTESRLPAGAARDRN